MNEAVIRKRLLELTESLSALPRSAKTPGDAGEGVYQPNNDAAEFSLEESLDHLRLQVKYLLFDLEATRRENRYLRQILETRPRPDRDDPFGGGKSF